MFVPMWCVWCVTMCVPISAMGDSDGPISDRTEIGIGLEITRFPISDPTGFDKTLQSRKVYIQTSKSTWTSPETDQIPTNS
jgi:hypothetical protein